MANLVVVSVILCASIILCNAKCGQLFENKVTNVDKANIINKHNSLRSLLTQGKVSNQPKAKNLKLMKWDDALAKEAQKIANSCELDHVDVQDRRFDVGQNLGLSNSTAKTSGADWNHIIQFWFDEHKDFIYPNTSKGDTGHYTQVAWADTYLIGCGYTMYRKSSTYIKLYVCNYGPRGNYEGRPPYKI